MATHRIQVQRTYGAPTNRSYHRLRMPRTITEQYIAEHGENLFIKAVSPDTLRIGGPSSGGMPIHILDVKESRGIAVRHHRQVMFPVKISAGMNRGDPVDITREGDTLVLKFGRAIFDVETQAAATQPGSGPA